MKTLFARAFTLFAFALGLGAYAASVGDTYSSTTAGSTTASTQGGWGEYDTWTLSIPATAELPAGTVIRIDSIKLGSRYNPHSNGNDKNAANAADASAALNEGETRILEVNGVKSAQVTDYTGTLVAGINNDNGSVTVGELTYTFSGLEVVVGASYTVKGYTADGATMKLRTRLVNKANYSGDVCVFGEVQANWYPVYAISGEVTGQYDYVALVDENTNFSNLSWVGGKDFSEATDESSVAVLVSAGTVTIDQDIDVGTLVISGGAVAVDGTHTVKATDGAIASPITIADGQTLKTGGTLRLTGANRISWGGTLEVADGSTSFNAAGTGINGTLKIDTDATLLSLASDAYNYNASSDTFLIVEGTLDMGSTRWSMGTRNTVTLAGGEITGTGEATNGAFDSMGPLTVTEDSTISAAIIRVRGNSSITVDANKTLTISGLVKRDNGDQGITKNGEGTLLLTGTQGDYAFVRVNGGKVVYDGVSPAASSTIEISGTGWVELQNLSNFYPAITGNGNIRVPTYALATSLNGAGFTGTVKVAGDDTTTTLEPIAPNLGAATTLDLTDFTALETINFNIGTRRTLCNIAVAEGVSPKLDYLTFRETLEDDGVLEIAIPSCFSSVEHVILYNADDVPTNITSSDLTDGTLTVEFPVSTKGKICWLDYEFDNDGHPKSDTETVSNPAHAYVPSTGSNATPLYFYNRTEVPENIYVADDEVDGNYFIKTTATPYGGCSFPETWTAAIRCSVPVTPKALIVSFGTQGGGCVGLAAGSAANEVVLARTTGNSAFDPAATMKVAKAATVQHLYVFVKTATTIKVYCDGSLVNTYTDGNGISFGNGFQIGSVNGSIGNTGFAQLDDTADANSQIDFIRLYNGEIGANLHAALVEEFGYVNSDVYTREVSGEEDISAEGAWEYNAETANAPAADANATVVAASADAALTVNADVSLDTFTVDAKDGVERASLTIKKGSGTFAVANAVFNASTVIESGALDLASSTVSVADGATLTFDLSGSIDLDYLSAETVVQLTGNAAEGLDIAATVDGGDASRVSVRYNANGYYEAVVAARATPKTLYLTVNSDITIDDATAVNTKLVDNAGILVAYDDNFKSTTLLAGDTLVLIAGSANNTRTITLANTGRLAGIQVATGSFTFANAVGDFTESVTLGGQVEAIAYDMATQSFSDAETITPANGGTGTVSFAYALGNTSLTLGANWTGTFGIGWAHTSGALVLDDYGNANSTVAINGGVTAGYLKAVSGNTPPSIAPAVVLNADVTLTNGYGSNTSLGNKTTFSRLSGSGSLTTFSNGNTGYKTYYEVSELVNYTGTLNISTKSAIKIDSVALDAEPANGIYVNAILSGTGSDAAEVVDLKTTPVTVGGNAAFTGLAVDAAAGGLVKALAAIGNATYASVADAIAVAEEQETVPAIEVLNGSVTATTELPAGWALNEEGTEIVYTEPVSGPTAEVSGAVVSALVRGEDCTLTGNYEGTLDASQVVIRNAAGEDVTAAYKITADDGTLTAALDVQITPDEDGEIWTENEENGTITLNVTVVKGFYYGVAVATELGGLEEPELKQETESKTGLTVKKPEGGTAFFQVFMSDQEPDDSLSFDLDKTEEGGGDIELN